jgi:hypothetical protein
MCHVDSIQDLVVIDPAKGINIITINDDSGTVPGAG